MARRDLKLVGSITEEIAEKHRMPEIANRPILQSLDFYAHITKHVKEFQTPENYLNALNNIPNALANPEFTFYDKEKGSILYYAKIDEVTCYVVKLNLCHDYCYLASLFPTSLRKLEKKKEESYLRSDIFV